MAEMMASVLESGHAKPVAATLGSPSWAACPGKAIFHVVRKFCREDCGNHLGYGSPDSS